MKFTFYSKIKLACLLVFFITSINSALACQESDNNCAAVDQWQFSLALGGGVLTNPLHGGDNIPLIVIPYVHYYGEQFFIENNTLGYSFYQSDNVIVSAISQLNREKAFFSNWQPKHLLLPNFSESIASMPQDDKQVSKNDIAKRKWAVDAGIQLNWFINDSLELKAQILGDLNNTYNGSNAHLSMLKQFSFKHLKHTQFQLAVGANWQSDALADYYYGLDENDGVDFFNLYQAKSSINPYLSFGLNHQLNNSWRLKFSAKQEFLDSNITNSPLVKDNTITSAFIGVVYAF